MADARRNYISFSQVETYPAPYEDRGKSVTVYRDGEQIGRLYREEDMIEWAGDGDIEKLAQCTDDCTTCPQAGVTHHNIAGLTQLVRYICNCPKKIAHEDEHDTIEQSKAIMTTLVKKYGDDAAKLREAVRCETTLDKMLDVTIAKMLDEYDQHDIAEICNHHGVEYGDGLPSDALQAHLKDEEANA